MYTKPFVGTCSLGLSRVICWGCVHHLLSNFKFGSYSWMVFVERTRIQCNGCVGVFSPSRLGGGGPNEGPSEGTRPQGHRSTAGQVPQSEDYTLLFEDERLTRFSEHCAAEADSGSRNAESRRPGVQVARPMCGALGSYSAKTGGSEGEGGVGLKPLQPPTPLFLSRCPFDSAG